MYTKRRVADPGGVDPDPTLEAQNRVHRQNKLDYLNWNLTFSSNIKLQKRIYNQNAELLVDRTSNDLHVYNVQKKSKNITDLLIMNDFRSVRIVEIMFQYILTIILFSSVFGMYKEEKHIKREIKVI